MNKPPKGPWVIERSCREWVVRKPGHGTILIRKTKKDAEEARDRENLAWQKNRTKDAADEMLAALQAVRPLMIPGMNWTDETGELVKSMVAAAIFRATGETQ